MAKFSGFAKSESYGSWESGVATFKNRMVKNEEGKEVSTEEWKVIFESGETYKFHESLFPEFPERIGENEEYFVSLVLETDTQGEKTKTVEKIDSIRPARWSNELLKIVDVTRNDNEEPCYYEKPSSYDENKVVRKVSWHLEFQEGEFKGAFVPVYIHYRFQNRGDGLAGWDFTEKTFKSKQATRIHECYEWYVNMLEIVSDDLPIEWPDDGNVVPELYARALTADKTFRASGKNGWLIFDTLEVVKVAKPSFDEVVKEVEEKAAEPVKKQEVDPGDW